MEGNIRGLIYGTNLKLAWKDWTKPWKALVRILDPGVEIRTRKARYTEHW